MIDSTKLLCELTKESPLSRKALYKRAEVSGSSAIKYCEVLAKLNLIRVEDIQRNFLTRLHYITLTGKINLIAITEPRIEQFGLNRNKLIRDTIAEIATTTEEPALKFVNKFLEAMFANNQLELILVWAKETSRELFWADPDEEKPEPRPEATLRYSWFGMIPYLKVSQLETYLRVLETVRPRLEKREAENAWYYLRRLHSWNPEYFEVFMQRVNLPGLTKWLSH